MSVDIRYKGSILASLNASGIRTLLTRGKYCEDNILVDADFITVYSGTTDPPASLGEDGDIYLKLV